MSKGRDKQGDSSDEDRKALGERLRGAREYLGFSQDQVATFLGVSRSALSLMETGQRKVEALELKKLAGLYKRPVGYFTDEDEDDASVDADVRHLARKVAELSAEDRREVVRFTEYLRSKKSMEG
jgi:transcriptional regulator with XRE-family HTH domain